MTATHFPYPSQAVCPRLVSALYTEAARLDQRWRQGCPDLPDDLRPIARQALDGAQAAADTIGRLARVDRVRELDWGPRLGSTIDLR